MVFEVLSACYWGFQGVFLIPVALVEVIVVFKCFDDFGESLKGYCEKLLEGLRVNNL